MTEGISHATEAAPAFAAFVDTIAALRAPDGCPWDRAQTHGSIAKNMLEEAYEAVDAIDAHDAVHLREELGDVLLQVVLQSQIAADAGEFTIVDVCADVNEKMIRRHPHIFGQAEAHDAASVNELWEAVKAQERAERQEQDVPAGLLDTVPVSFPALTQAYKISKKAVGAGFEWDTVDDVWVQADSEMAELKEAYALAPKDERGHVIAGTVEAFEAELELGDVLFSLVNVGRKMGLDAEGSLRATCEKFRRRWAFMEGLAWAQGETLEGMSFEELQVFWQQAKLAEKSREAHDA